VATILFAYLVAVAGAAAVDPQVVLIAATADDEQMAQLEEAVSGASATVHLQVLATRVAKITVADVLAAGPAEMTTSDQTRPIARLWIDAASGSPITLYLTDGARRRLYVRQVPVETGALDRVALESIAFIVGSSIDALLAGQAIGVSREAFAKDMVAAPAPSAPVVVQAPAPPSVPRLAIVSVAYELVRTAPVPYQHRVVVGYQSYWKRMCAGLGVFAAAPQVVGGVPAGARLLTAGLTVSGGAHWFATRSLRLIAGAGAGIEAVRVEPTASASDLRATARFWSGALSLRGFGVVERELGRRWLVGLTIGVEAHPSPERYVIGGGQMMQIVVESPRWRPLAGVFVGGRI